MQWTFTDQKTGGKLMIFNGEDRIESPFRKRDHDNKYFTIAWNRGKQQKVSLDGQSFVLKSQHILPIMFDQTFQFAQPADIVAWQFNREFYCIIDHDAEVSCVGFLFGLGDNHFINLSREEQQDFTLLLNIFLAEIKTPDHIQHEILLVLLKRLIIRVTTMARGAFMDGQPIPDDKYNIIRKFSLLVEGHFRSEHAVSYYANRLNKSPKTLSNLFALYNNKAPSLIIQERIIMEAKRLLYYTEKSAKEITYELGFEDSAYFSAYFKKHTLQSPLEFRGEMVKSKKGK